MALQSGASTSSSSTQRGDGSEDTSKPKHTVFLSHSGFQKPFVEHLCLGFEKCFRYPFFDKRPESIRIGDSIPQHIFDAIRECRVGAVILSEEFLTSKWPMMELAAMHERVLDEGGKEKSNFKIVPVFLHISPKEFDDPANWKRWRLSWDELAMRYPKRVQVEKWEAAVKYVRSIKGPVCNGLDEMRFQNEIVDGICELVPPETKLDDSHIQGSSRLCKVIRDEIDMLQKDANNGVCVLGLYGMGGLGKTTICKALCNEFSTRFRGRVCHAELERGSEKELLRELLKSLTNRNHVSIKKLNVDQMRDKLSIGVIEEPVFLALDNMSGSDESMKQVKRYLSARLPSGSIVMVTARSKDLLTNVVKPHINGRKCVAIPELEVEEAKSLFVKSSDVELRNDINEELILRCVEQCHYWKNDGSGGRHYHPLALDVLGRQLARLSDPKQWASALDRINEDIFNLSEEIKHPVFSILRTSFETLIPRDQLLFMDVALFLPEQSYLLRRYWDGGIEFEWLRIVHGMSTVDDVKRALERLKTKSVVECVGDGYEKKTGMHDLWRAFCKAETKHGELGLRRWLYVGEDVSDLELVESSPGGPFWENVKRMAFLDSQLEGLGKTKFAQFSNVAVLRISGVSERTELLVDLSGLIHLKSLELSGPDSWSSGRVVLQGLPQSLIFLRVLWKCGEVLVSRETIEEISCLKDLQYLELTGYGGSELPDMRSMVSLRVAIFARCEKVVTVAGLSSELTWLRILVLNWCRKLRSCPGVGDLVALERLNCMGCNRLEKLPNLQKLRNLRELNISSCNLITGVPGLGDLSALEELDAESSCSYWVPFELPDMRKLTNLQVLNLNNRSLVGGVRGLENLICLQRMAADFRKVVDNPNIEQLTNLLILKIGGLRSTGLRGLDKLVMLQSLKIDSCSGVDEMPEFRSLTRLRTLEFEDCEFKDLSGLSNLQSTLEVLFFRKVPITESMPDLGNFLQLKELILDGCASLKSLPIREPMNALLVLSLTGCTSLATLPDLCTFPVLVGLSLRECDGITMLSSSVPINTLQSISVESCSGLKALPDVVMFPRLQRLLVQGCCSLAPVSTSMPLPELSSVTTYGHGGLSRDNLDRLRAESGSQFRVFH